MIKCSNYKVDFNIDSFIKEELPVTYNFFDGEFNEEYRSDLEDLFSYVSKNKDSMPFYEVSETAVSNLTSSCENFYAAMHHCLGHLFDDPEGLTLAKNFFGETLVKHPRFFNYARYTYENSHPAIYGRYDVAMTREGEVKGIYEFNGDTPVMLFESVILQNNLVSQLGKEDWQCNNYYEGLRRTINTVLPKGNIGIILDYEYIEDITTCETMKQILEESGREVYIGSIKDLDFESTDYSKPFQINDVVLDNIFILSPWEEMLDSDSANVFLSSDHWKRNVRFLEPAWRWFFANKGMLAYMTFLAENFRDFEYIMDLEGFLPAYLSPDEFLEQGEKFVGKPLTGRLSNNIIFFNETGEPMYQSEGAYGDDDYIYQMLCSPDQVEGRNNFIAGMWMTPYLEEDLAMEAATFCIREFDKPILDIKNERFIPHIVV